MKVATLPYDPQWRALEWIKENCPSYITNDVHKEKGTELVTRIDYFFGDDRDVVWTLLRWS